MTKEYTGGSVSYYRVKVDNPTSPDLPPYVAECNDIIEALGMNYAQGNAFKAIWRMCAAKFLQLSKEGYKDGLYDSQKVEFFGARMVAQESPKPIINNPSRVELYSADAEARMDVIGQNGPTGEHYADMEKAERWKDAPEWATVLLKSKWNDHLTCFAESYTDGSRFLRSDFGKDTCRDLDPDCWHLVESRP